MRPGWMRQGKINGKEIALHSLRADVKFEKRKRPSVYETPNAIWLINLIGQMNFDENRVDF